MCFDHSVRKTIQLSSPQGRLLPASLTTHLVPFFLCIRIDSTAADHCARLSIIAAARIGIREQDLCNCRASVCLSVRHIIGPLHVAAAGLLLWARRQEIYRSTAKRPALSSKCERVALSADVGPNYITSVLWICRIASTSQQQIPQQCIAPGAARRYAPRPMAVRRSHIFSPPIRPLESVHGSENRGGSTSVLGRVRSPHISIVAAGG